MPCEVCEFSGESNAATPNEAARAAAHRAVYRCTLHRLRHTARRWHRSLSNLAGEAVSLPAYWKQQFGADWEKFEVTSDVLTLAKEAGETWSGIVESLINREKGKKT